MKLKNNSNNESFYNFNNINNNKNNNNNNNFDNDYDYESIGSDFVYCFNKNDVNNKSNLKRTFLERKKNVNENNENIFFPISEDFDEIDDNLNINVNKNKKKRKSTMDYEYKNSLEEE